ncbi:MAG: phosphatase PAP2 family protein [Eubacteriales bacterium]|nr:phosphatase PAP2 family protein [Eubacteriales bacterium]
MNFAAVTLTPFAQWLNTFFEGYDYKILDFLNTLAINAGGILTPVMKVISFLGEKGIMFFLLAFILLLFPKTRKVGVCVFGAVCCGALIGNIILKDMIARPRPFEANNVFRSFWSTVGSPAEDGFSFPSGHVTAAAAGMFALWFSKGKKFALPTILWVGLMMISRNYLMAHYPSDVLAALIVGIFSAAVAWLITCIIFNRLEDNDDYPFCNFVLNAALPFTAPSADTIRDKAASSVKSIRKKASSISLPDVKGTVSKVRSTASKHTADTPEVKAAPAKKQEDWNSRWDNYKKKKPSAGNAADEDVKVFSGTSKIETEPSEEPSPVKKTAVEVAEENIEVRPVRPAAPKAPKPRNDDFDDLADIKALLESDTFFDEEETAPAPRTRSRMYEGGEYRGRH